MEAALDALPTPYIELEPGGYLLLKFEARRQGLGNVALRHGSHYGLRSDLHGFAFCWATWMQGKPKEPENCVCS